MIVKQIPCYQVCESMIECWKTAECYCMLNEMLFCTGLMEIFCNRGIREGSEAAFYLSMARMSLAQPLHAAQQYSARKPFDLYAFLRADLTQYSHFHHPVAFHVNYCGNKMRYLHDRNLWLLQDNDKCRPFALQQSHYEAIPWSDKLKHSQSALHRALQEELFKDAGNTTVSVEDLKRRLEGKMVKFHNAHTVFKVENGQLRPLVMQTTAQHVMVWHHEMLHLLPIGKEL